MLFILFAAGCGKDDVDYGLDEYRVDLATVTVKDGKQVFILDNGKSLFNAGQPLKEELKDNQRVQINYSILPLSTPGFDYTVKINYIASVSQGELVGKDILTIYSLANDPVRFESVSIGSHYMNIRCYIEFYSQQHSIYLVTDASKITNDTVHIAFRHNKNNDPRGHDKKVVASYNLEKLLGKPSGNRTLLVNFNTTNYRDTVFKLSY